MNLQQLLATHGPELSLAVAPEADLWAQAVALARANPRTVARVVRGHKATAKAACLDEFAAAFQFPPSFGDNWDALRDCLCDLSWLAADECLIVVTQARQLLAREPHGELKTFGAVMAQVAEDRRHAGKGTSRVVLQVSPGEEAALRKHLASAGIMV